MTSDEMVVELQAENAALRRQVTLLEERIAELEGKSGKKLPGVVKPNRPKREGLEGPRKARETRHDQARQREEPTRRVRYGLERCPECSYQLRGESVDYVRQVMELPPPQPIESQAGVEKLAGLELSGHRVHSGLCLATTGGATRSPTRVWHF